MSGSCCAPGREAGSRSPAGSGSEEKARPGPAAGSGVLPTTLMPVPGGRYRMGDESEWSYPGDGEGPVHDVDLAAFLIDSHAVTNRQFADFVDATGWRTDAERYEWSFVFGGLLPDDFPPTTGGGERPVVAPGHGRRLAPPRGPHIDVTDRLDHPVVHVSWNDARGLLRMVGYPAPHRGRVGGRGPGRDRRDQPFPLGRPTRARGQSTG